MEFGMFHEFPSLPGRSETEAFDEAIEQVDAAERWGLDAMWLAEITSRPSAPICRHRWRSPARSRPAPAI